MPSGLQNLSSHDKPFQRESKDCGMSAGGMNVLNYGANDIFYTCPFKNCPSQHVLSPGPRTKMSIAKPCPQYAGWEALAAEQMHKVTKNSGTTIQRQGVGGYASHGTQEGCPLRTAGYTTVVVHTRWSGKHVRIHWRRLEGRTNMHFAG